jgi:hypothetical protein
LGLRGNGNSSPIRASVGPQSSVIAQYHIFSVASARAAIRKVPYTAAPR